MLPAQRRGEGKQLGGHRLARGTEMGERVCQVCRVPVDNRGDDEVQARGAELLRLGALLADPPLVEGADHLGRRMPLLALVQAGMAAPAKVRTFQPVQHEQRPLDAAELLQCQIEMVLAPIGCKHPAKNENMVRAPPVSV